MELLERASFLQTLAQRGKRDFSSLIEFCSSISLLTVPPRHEAVRRMLTQALGRIWRMNLPELLERPLGLIRGVRRSFDLKQIAASNKLRGKFYLTGFCNHHHLGFILSV